MTTPDDTGPAAATTRDRPLVPRALVVLLGAAAAVILFSGIRAIDWLIGPAFLALVVVITVSPVQAWARRRGWPGWLTTTVLLVLVFGVVVAFVLVLLISVARLATLLPQYADHAQQLLHNLTTSLDRFGVTPRQLQAAAKSLDPSHLVAAIGSLLSGLASAASSLVFLLSLLLFLGIESSGMDRRLAAVAGDRPSLEQAFRSYAHNVRSYMAVSTVFGLIVGVLDGIGLAIMGIPLPVLWGLLSFITNYIPNIGFVLGLIPPALLGLLDGGWQQMVAVIVLYSVLNFVIQSLIQPRFVGDSVGLSTTVTFLSLIFWAWLLGPLGALLAIPATLLITSFLVDIDPRAGWARALLGSLERAPREPRRRRKRAVGEPPAADEERAAADEEPPAVGEPQQPASAPGAGGRSVAP